MPLPDDTGGSRSIIIIRRSEKYDEATRLKNCATPMSLRGLGRSGSAVTVASPCDLQVG